MASKSSARSPRNSVDRKRTGEVKRKLTVYLSPELHRALGHFAVDHDLDLSGAAVMAIERMLGDGK
jgi:hypothetical protein